MLYRSRAFEVGGRKYHVFSGTCAQPGRRSHLSINAVYRTQTVERGKPPKETALRIFRGLSGSYDSVLDYATLYQDRRWKSWVLEEAAIGPGLRVLDIGCGTGALEERLPGCSVVGVDITREMIREAQRKGIPSVESLVLSDGEALPFGDGTFDVVTSCYVVKYTTPSRLVSEAARVLKPGGRFVLYDFVRPRGALWPLNAAYVYGVLRVLGVLLGAAGASEAYTFQALPDVILSRPWEVGFGQLLAEHGFAEPEPKLLSGGVAIGFSASRA
jgi:demethylmenaquinone methyltransferase / 2-methoxy-6-polyprenyl-1,4-benzoquinol methylase